MLEFVLSELDFAQDENNFMNPLLQVGSGSGGPKINGSDWIRILIPDRQRIIYFSLIFQ